MKVKLEPGAEFDFVTAGEIRGILGDTLRAWNRGPSVVQTAEVMLLDSGGEGTISAYQVPIGYRFILHRLLIDLDAGVNGYSPGTPYTDSDGWADIQRAGHREDFVVFTGGLPCVATWGESDGIFYRNGEIVQVDVHDGPASLALTIRVQGTLQPLTTD